MNIVPDPAGIYQERIIDLNKQLATLRKKRNNIAWSRLACIVAAIGIFYYVLPAGAVKAIVAALIPIAVFLRLVVITVTNNARIHNLQLQVRINEEELTIANGIFHHREDGIELLPELHDYAHDLDIFGKASLYQYINRTTSEQGRHLLGKWLLAPADSATILQRQKAARELAPQYKWRQQLQAWGMTQQITLSTREKLLSWLQQPNRFITKKHWRGLRFLLPGIILTALLLNIIGVLASPLFYGMVFIFFLLSGAISKKIIKDYLQLGKIVEEISTLSNSIDCIEQQHFEAELLKDLQKAYIPGTIQASAEVRKLKKILERLDLRLNPAVFLPLNIFFFWDLQQVMALECWKEKNKNIVPKWFDSLAEMEALATLAALHFNHAQWCFPTMDSKEGTFMAENLGHPLLAESKRVCSSFTTTGKPQLALITGSNMAGKSTFLRSVGINIVLGTMGAPVCAERCSMYPTRVISSMRIADNLAESASTFYAELKKLKYIIDAVNNKEEVFLLLDEILRGTNSLDRHTGSEALINQLIRHKAAGILATHDLELAKLAEKYPAFIQNYHFDVQVEKEELYFDYKLKSGICRSLNASILMKKIGIEL